MPPGKHHGWSSFVASGERELSEAGNPEHRVRVEYSARTLLVHLSDEDGTGWTVCDRS
jgi:hypothetical protein